MSAITLVVDTGWLDKTALAIRVPTDSSSDVLDMATTKRNIFSMLTKKWIETVSFPILSSFCRTFVNSVCCRLNTSSRNFLSKAPEDSLGPIPTSKSPNSLEFRESSPDSKLGWIQMLLRKKSGLEYKSELGWMSTDLI
ncbi:hypothetical protein OGAPHI_003626 [Ogataea philodendri]|uniref:Uncharacterized protein n=1 Tax=Ogataea philodendri TaxID=1378263 RepID=A0A9P8P5Q3_9ASCO|nr:uncharacterized protein OGAPHI_003626 [Ogataea philodendri]KAH3665442.1 hypothetical protein OGAPHI_003626 [Ogataea philodendri]